LLQEYYASLISNVVTGKLDVRAAAAALPDDVDEPKELEASDPAEHEPFAATIEEVDDEEAA
jgi:type I restriction enzyme S subunit